MYSFYNVKEYKNGCVLLEPRELTLPERISAKLLSRWIKQLKTSNLIKFQSQLTCLIFERIFTYEFQDKKNGAYDRVNLSELPS